jgi:hypothetical protein
MMAGALNSKTPKRDPHGLYRAACEDLADTLGWKRRELWAHFDELACLREFEMRIPRPLAEFFALQDLHACFNKQGATGD